MKKHLSDGSAKDKICSSDEGKSGWNDVGGYMRAKVRKLDAQFKQDIPVSENSSSTKIFKKVVIHVDGYTVPSTDELRRLVYEHGGRYQQYYKKSTVTHIIATNLPDSKIKQLRDEKVVRPEWIVDSVKANKLLPENDYLLYQRHKSTQGLLSKTKSGVADAVDACRQTNIPGSRKTVLAMGVEMEDHFPLKEPHLITAKAKGACESKAEEMRPSSNVMESSEIRGLQEGNLELCFEGTVEMGSSEDSDADDTNDLRAGLHGISKLSETNGLKEGRLECQSVNILTNTEAEAGSVSEGTGNMELKLDLPLESDHDDTVKNGHSRHSVPRAGDANFVSEFYKNSRLHYLSTWGAEFKEFTSKLIKTRIAQGKALRQNSSAGPNPHGRVIMHIDMDSFFVSVTLRDKPHLREKPIAVCHAGKGNPADLEGGQPSKRMSPEKLSSFFNSMSEIASCSYEARAFGVRNGMLLGSARQLCPDIICVPYEFQKYRQVSQRLYEILVSYTHEIEAVSCDEAYIDVSNRLDENNSPTDLAQSIRDDIYQATGCTASAGISFNVLLARMCTKKAKPNGQFYLSRSDNVQEFMGPQSVRDLPGVGWALNEKLQSLNIRTCGELQRLNLQTLQREFGPKSGASLHQASRGLDDRPLRTEHKRKSVSAEINYGIRFTKNSEAHKFIDELALEVHKRLKAVDMKGKCVTLKLKVRKAGAPMPRKFMGHGICDNITRSSMLKMATDESAVIARECVTLLRDVKAHAEDMRGMGIQVSKLSPSSESRGARTLLDFVNLHAESSHASEPSRGDDVTGVENEDERELRASLSSVQTTKDAQATSPDNALPPLPRFSPPMTSFPAAPNLSPDDGLPSPSQVDPSVLAALPEDIRRSIERSYAVRNQNLPVFVAKTPKHKGRGPFHASPRTKNTSPSRKESLFNQSRLTPSRVDPDFLAALPDDVREEVELAYRLRMPEEKQDVPRPNEKGKSMKRREPSEITLTEQSADSKSHGRATEVGLGGAVNFPDVKEVLRAWTRGYEVPLEEDVQEVCDYLLHLIDGNNLEQVSSVLKFLSRAIHGLEEATAWRAAYNGLTDRVQESIAKRYNSRLVL